MTPCVSPAAFLQFLKGRNTMYGTPAVRISEISQVVKSLRVKFFHSLLLICSTSFTQFLDNVSSFTWQRIILTSPFHFFMHKRI